MAGIYQFRTDKDVNFTGGIAQNARADENILLPPGLQPTGGTAYNIIRAVGIISDQNLDWDLYVFNSTAFSNADLDLDTFNSVVSFAVAAGKQIAGAGSFYYYTQGLNIPVYDANATGKIHLSLVNRNVTAKNAGATGEIVIILWMEPMQYGAGA